MQHTVSPPFTVAAGSFPVQFAGTVAGEIALIDLVTIALSDNPAILRPPLHPHPLPALLLSTTHSIEPMELSETIGTI